MTVAALVLGAGSGERLRESLRETRGSGRRDAHATAAAPGSALSKAFIPLAGRSLLARSIAALASAQEIDQVVPVLPPECLDHFDSVLHELDHTAKVAAPVGGGDERQDSVRRGLVALSPEIDHVAIHDAARPLVRPHDVDRVVRVARRHGAALLAVPAADTIHRVREGRVLETPLRAECFTAQTPQVFRADWLREALAKADAEGYQGTDDAELVARLGVAVHVVLGDPSNLKITRASDLDAALVVLQARGEVAR
jgi:2-C-methyl-D-erythritol 4-phosphate cytidylyltransferase